MLDRVDKEDIFIGASMSGYPETVKILLKAGVNVHVRDECALQNASLYGHTEVVKLLLEAGADIHAVDDGAFRWARENGHTEIIKLLENWGKNKPNTQKLYVPGSRILR